MTSRSSREPKTRAVNLRLREDVRGLIDRAARARGKTRSDFMIDAARKAAEEALLDLTLVGVDAESYEHFLYTCTGQGGLSCAVQQIVFTKELS